MLPCAHNCGECPDWNAGCTKGFKDIGDCAFIGVDGYYDPALYDDVQSDKVAETEEIDEFTDDEDGDAY